MPITKDIFIKKFLKSLDNGDAAIFAGAGLSAPSGCVNWKELLKDIAEEIQLDIDKESDLVTLAQYYYNKNGNNRTRLNEIIKDAFQTGKTPNINHNILASLPISTYWTTNYDKLIDGRYNKNVNTLIEYVNKVAGDNIDKDAINDILVEYTAPKYNSRKRRK